MKNKTIRIDRRKGTMVFDVFTPWGVFIVCKHLHIWREADYFADCGGKACRKCVEKGREYNDLGNELLMISTENFLVNSEIEARFNLNKLENFIREHENKKDSI